MCNCCSYLFSFLAKCLIFPTTCGVSIFNNRFESCLSSALFKLCNCGFPPIFALSQLSWQLLLSANSKTVPPEEQELAVGTIACGCVVCILSCAIVTSVPSWPSAFQRHDSLPSPPLWGAAACDRAPHLAILPSTSPYLLLPPYLPLSLSLSLFPITITITISIFMSASSLLPL